MVTIVKRKALNRATPFTRTSAITPSEPGLFPSLSVGDHVEILVYKRKKKLQAEVKTTGITPHEPTEIENLLDTITALEESAGRAKAEDVRLKAMEEESAAKKKDSSADESDDKPKRQRRSGGRPKDEEGASNTRERENGGLEETANANATAISRHAKSASYAAATATKPTAITQLSDDDDDGVATATVKGFDGVIGKNDTYNK
ncbi:hypothetical protein P5673_012223 [Acropora cervicornis]|uniref:Uncharacterized protein n=1 Tax=Acropora cervicornis TaxID=6130 RepID=A0AAD9QMF0_ACRCE|nr:hypothetical protein P5673_012223 [Acropora cervicornis]